MGQVAAFIPALTAVDAELARRSLYQFVLKTWSKVEPNAPYVDNWHVPALCRILEKVTNGEIKRLIINVAPGSMKSLLVSVFWPAWMWQREPALRIFAAAYSSHLSLRDNTRLRDIVTSTWYQGNFPHVELSGDQNAKVLFNTTKGGWRFATSVGGAGTGEHPDYVIIDDPHTADQARSDVERQSALDWFDRTISTRGIARDVRVVIIMQRLHQEDLSGHLLARGGWTHVCWPMYYDPKRPDPYDPRREPGELFWPQLFTAARVEQLQRDLGPYGAAGQLQQLPAPEGGGLFKREWFEIVDAAPTRATRCRGWDTGGTEGGGDWTCGVKIARADGVFYVEDVRRGQWGPKTVDDQMQLTAQLDGRECRQREEQEPGSAGKAVVATRTRTLVGFDYGPSPTTGDKVTRARPYRAQCEARNVKLVRGPWNEAYLQELEVFPNGAHDDQVDGSSAAFNELATGPLPVRELEALWG